MRRDHAFPSKYLSKADVEDAGGALNVTIATVQTEDVKSESGNESKAICYFHEVEKGLVLNGVNWDSIAEMTGEDDSDDWVDFTICLYVDPSVRFGSKKVGGIRVRKPATAKTQAPAGRRRAPTPPPQDDEPPPPGDEDSPF